MNTVLFLCTGNYYRSRFAEIFFNWHADRQALNWHADSRGLALDPLNPGMMSRASVQRLAQQNISVEDYQRPPRDLTLADLQTVQHVVAVKETEHRPLIATRFPLWLERVEFWEVHDLDCAGPEVALPHLEREVFSLVNRLKSSQAQPTP